MSDKVLIRDYQSDDYSEVAVLWEMAELLQGNDSEELYKKQLKRNPGLLIVAELDGVIVGAVYGFFPYTVWHLPRTRFGYIGHLAVHPQVHGMGIGSKLVEEICTRLVKNGKSFVFLFATPMEAKSEDLYRFYRDRHGFKNIGRLFYKRLDS